MARQEQDLREQEAILLQRIRQEQHPVVEEVRRLVSVWEARQARVLASCPREDLVEAQAQLKVYALIFDKLSTPPMKENTDG